ncbi:MAG: hypothetical protein AAGB51_09245 [Planctomycetota bacterium]
MISHDQNRFRTRRGAAVAAIVLVVALMNLLVLASARGGVDASESDALRVETVRAFFAAESGADAVLVLLNAGSSLPDAGTVTSLGLSEIEFIELPAGASGDVVIEGRSGFAARRVGVTLN